MNKNTPIVEPDLWKRLNREQLEAEIARLRLLLHRRALWLRQHWTHEASQDYMAWRISNAQADWLLGGEDRAAEAAFYANEPDAATLGASLAAVEARIAGTSVELQRAGAPATLDVLTRLFELSPFERDVFLLALAPEVDSSFERLYAYVHDDLTRRQATPQLALTLLASEQETADARDYFMPEATLRRFRLVGLDDAVPPPGFANRPLRVDERLLNFVLGVNRPDERLASVLAPAPVALIASADRTLVERIAGWAQTGDLASRAVNLVGSADASPLHLARAVCDELRIDLFQVNAASLPAARAERRELLALLEREAVLLQTALYLDLDAIRAEERRELTDDIDRLRVFIVIASGVRWPGTRETFAAAVRKPDASQQAELWQHALAPADDAEDLEIAALVEQFDLGTAQIGRAVTAARELATLRDGDATPTADDLWRACEQEAAPKLDELAQRIVPCYAWDDIVLPPEPFRQLQEISAQVSHRAQVYQSWGFGAKLNRGRGISALFAGASGTGKTMAAEVLAQHLRLDLYRIDLAGVVSKYIGETERNLRSIFAAAERGGVILFFDECDALFGKRSEVKDSHDRYANIEVNYLLQRMEDFRGLAILATNRRSALDSAFVRRLRFIVDFPFPDAAHRRRIWESMFPPEADLQGLDIAWHARLEIPGGHIRNIALAAAFLAAEEGEPIGMLHVMRAARREYTKMDRIVQEADFGPYYAAVTS
jgi:AAA+ superfamily predicted ATPase